MDEILQRYHQRITVGAVAVVTNPEGSLLFVSQTRGPFAGYWLLPGGTIEPGESAEDAVIRELHEETGITIREPRFQALYELRGRWVGGAYHIMLLAFRGESEEKIPFGFQGDHVDSVQWADPNRLPIHSTQLRILADAGLAAQSPEQISKALLRDGVVMKDYHQAQQGQLG